MKAVDTLPLNHPIAVAWRTFRKSESFFIANRHGRDDGPHLSTEEVMFTAFASGYSSASIDAGIETALAGPAVGEFIDQDRPVPTPEGEPQLREADDTPRPQFSAKQYLAESTIHGNRRPYRPGGPNDLARVTEELENLRLATRDHRIATADSTKWSYDGLPNQFPPDQFRPSPLGGALALYRLPEQDRNGGQLQAFMGADRVVYWVPRGQS